jgi:16S rRNA (cytidine1402-2'-O)-methyltransferase
LQELSDIPATLVFYESPKRVAAMLKDAAEVLGAERQGAVCRELTKKFEQVRRGSLQDLAEQAVNDPPRGEIVVIIDRNRSDKNKDLDLDSEIRKALTHMSVKDTADAVAKAFGLKKRDVYQRVLQIGQNRTG